MMTSWIVPALIDAKGEGWDFAAWEGGLKITANCSGANITLRGDQLVALEELLGLARRKTAA
jgi:hypothetical protein